MGGINNAEHSLFKELTTVSEKAARGRVYIIEATNVLVFMHALTFFSSPCAALAGCSRACAKSAVNDDIAEAIIKTAG